MVRVKSRVPLLAAPPFECIIDGKHGARCTCSWRKEMSGWMVAGEGADGGNGPIHPPPPMTDPRPVFRTKKAQKWRIPHIESQLEYFGLEKLLLLHFLLLKVLYEMPKTQDSHLSIFVFCQYG